MNFYAASRRSARRSLWLVLPHTPAGAEASEAETAVSGINPRVAVQAELKTCTVKDEERGDRRGGQRRIRKVEGGEKGVVDERVERVIAGNAAGKREGDKRKSYGRKGCKEEEEEEEEEAVAVIAGVLRKRFGPQIVREVEDWESGIRSSGDRLVVGTVKEAEEADGGNEEEEEEEEGGVEGYWEEEDEEAGSCEEDAPGATSPPTPPPLLNGRRVVSPSSLLSLYRFFSSHLGISSPSTVASVLVYKPQLLRSNPTSDFLPRVRLLRSYGISDADIAHITVREPAWLRVSLARIRNNLEFLLAQGVRRSRLGSVLVYGRGVLWWEARSTNLDILVERAGVPVDKLGAVIEGYPAILTRRKEAVNTHLEMLSAHFKAKCGGNVEADGTSASPLRQRLDEPNLDKNHLTKLQFFVELLGEEAAGRMARSHPTVLHLSKENVQGKVAVLADLLGRENAVRAMARFPPVIASSVDGMRESFGELVREVEEALESSGEEGSGMQRLGEGDGVAVAPAVAEELLFRGLLLTALQEELGSNSIPLLPCLSWYPELKSMIDAAMLSAALFALFHLSLSLLFPNLALEMTAGLLVVYPNYVPPAVALHTTHHNASALLTALMATDAMPDEGASEAVSAAPHSQSPRPDPPATSRGEAGVRIVGQD
ncbi:unnamed protein product [Closterium sp. NIES-64]|nr:unnamed protein product [Closterium sp. NIES-64]